MPTAKCRYCKKPIKAVNERQLDSLMMSHIVNAHRNMLTIIFKDAEVPKKQ